MGIIKLSRLIIVVHYDRFFGRKEWGWQTLDLDLLKAAFSEDYEVEVCSIEELAYLNSEPGDIVLYGSSDDPSIRQYYKDVLYLVDRNTRIVPNYQILLAHENKGFQELLGRQLNISIDNGLYLYDPRGLPLCFPFVLKEIDGAGSSKVALVTSARQRDRAVRKLTKISLRRRMLMGIRRLQLPSHLYQMYCRKHRGYRQVVKQKFIADLSGDFKVLVFGKKYYVLNRKVRSGDFRASGSGRFEFKKDPDTLVLNFAREVFKKLDVPYLSMDIAKDESGTCHLIEFQGLHFGPYTILHSPGSFSLIDGRWLFTQESAVLENEFAQSVISYLHDNADSK